MKNFFVTLYLCDKNGNKIENMPFINHMAIRGESIEDVREYMVFRGIDEIKECHDIFKNPDLGLLLTDVTDIRPKIENIRPVN